MRSSARKKIIVILLDLLGILFLIPTILFFTASRSAFGTEYIPFFLVFVFISLYFFASSYAINLNKGWGYYMAISIFTAMIATSLVAIFASFNLIHIIAIILEIFCIYTLASDLKILMFSKAISTPRNLYITIGIFLTITLLLYYIFSSFYFFWVGYVDQW